MDARKYKYRPLDPSKREIRLLNVLSSDRFSSQVKCSISTTTLDDDPEYAALSYCWGDSSNPIRIVLEDDGLASPSRSYLWVGSNLHAALRRIRKLTDGTRIWIDAICIDQDNTSERNHQVGFMREIYEKAEQTIIWLGDAYENSGLAIGLIKAWTRADDDLDLFLQRYPFAFSIQMWTAVDKLLRRPWWHRIWVYQEYLLSREIIFVCGSEWMTNEELDDAVKGWEARANTLHQHQVIPNQAWRVLFQPNHGREFSTMMLHRKLRNMRRQERQAGLVVSKLAPKLYHHYMSLLALIVWTRNKEATDPRDRLFALLGINEVEDVPVTIDYNRSVLHVYTEFAVNYMSAKRDLGIFSIAGVSTDSSGRRLPSWVPDLRTIRKENITFELLYGFSASGDCGPTFSIDEGHDLLTVKGFVCDVVRDCRPRCPGREWHDKWIDIALDTVYDHPTGIPKLQAFFRTMIGDRRGYGFGRPEFADEDEEDEFWRTAKGFIICWAQQCKNMGTRKDDPAFEERFQRWKRCLKSRNFYAISLQFAANALREDPLGKTDDELLSPFLRSVRGRDADLAWPKHGNDPSENEKITLKCKYEFQSNHMAAQRSFFTSDKGYMGLGRTIVQPEDEICIIFGCSVPLVLRKSGRAHILIGPAYIYGMMKGEMIHEFENGAFKEQDFVLD